MKNKVVIAFDFGTSSIGMAIGQQITMTSSPLTRIKVKNKKFNWLIIKKIFFEWHPELLIIGLPIAINGKEHFMNNKIYKFADCLYKMFNIPVHFHNEHLTTIEAKAILFDIGGYRMLKKDRIDSVSAMVILNSWFNSLKII